MFGIDTPVVKTSHIDEEPKSEQGCLWLVVMTTVIMYSVYTGGNEHARQSPRCSDLGKEFQTRAYSRGGMHE